MASLLLRVKFARGVSKKKAVSRGILPHVDDLGRIMLACSLRYD
jgi:hypothetical protein